MPAPTETEDSPSSNMQTPPVGLLVLENAEVFDFSQQDPTKPLHTTVVCEKDEGFCITKINCRLHDVPRMLTNTEQLDGIFVSPAEVFPTWQDGPFTLAQKCPSSGCFLKRQSLLEFSRDDESQKDLLTQEARFLEELKRNPHPNIATYHGCVRQNNLLAGLCLEKYCETLSERVRRKVATLNIDKCIRAVRSGIEHLHLLGYCHNDINPANIMFKTLDDETPIIIDFDSCIRTGDPLGMKGGTMNFSEDRITHSLPENDFCGLRLVEKFMREE